MKKVYVKGIVQILDMVNLRINKKVIRHNISGIKSFNHKMFTYESNKISLSTFDDKRYILDNGISTLAYGHKDIPKKHKVKISYYY